MADQIVNWYRVQNVGVTSCSSDLPAAVKKMRHHMCCASPDLTESIVLSPDDLDEIRLTDEEAEAIHKGWEEAKTWTDLDGETVNPYKRTLLDKMRPFFSKDWDDVKRKIRG